MAGNVISVTDGEKHQVKYGYNTSGSLSNRTDADRKVLLRYDYDLNGNHIRQSNIIGKSKTYIYNVMDLLEEIYDNMSSARYSYHSNGMIKSLSVGDKLIPNYEYDRDKNLTRQWTKMQGAVKEEKRISLGITVKTLDNMTP